MKLKKTAALCTALFMATAMASCGSSSSSSSEDDFSATENVKVEDTDVIAAIPEGAEKEILFMGVDDVNPTKANPEKSTQMTLFESKGGKVNYSQVSYLERFDKLAATIMAQKDTPDIVNYEWLSFPAQVVQKMYQPIDSIIDFKSSLWAGTTDTAEKFCLDGNHYVAPLYYEASAIMCYDKDIIDAEGLDDPYELYVNGEWNWDNWSSIMRTYCSNATADTERYGINGFFRQHVIQQTGKTLVNYDEKTNQFTSNLNDPDIEKGQEMMYQLSKENIILNGWIGSARDAFRQGCLFFAMGDWGFAGNNTPKENDHWGVVPMPQYTDNPQKITTSDMKAYMWVAGSEKADTVKCWMECCRVAATDTQYKETNKKKFLENNPQWTEDMYNVKTDVVSDEYSMAFDYAYGISTALGDASGFDGNVCLVDALYTFTSSLDEDGNQPTWTQLREKYSATVDSELKTINQKVKEFSSK